MEELERHGLILRIILLFGNFITFCSTDEVDLLNSKDYDTLSWQTYPVYASPANVGWRESSTNLENGPVRIYRACYVDKENVQNWLRTPYISKKGAHRLYIEINFMMRRCTKFPKPENLQQCKESFRLLYYEAESDFANAQMPTWDTDTYKEIDNIAADKMWDENTPPDEDIFNTEIISVDIIRAGAYFAFLDTGACAAVISVRIFYKYCPGVTQNLAIFPNTTTGSKLSSIQQASGTCVKNAVVDKHPQNLCKADGTWSLISGGCVCSTGFEPYQQNKCVPCRENHFKWTSGNHECKLCPTHSSASDRGQSECHCDTDYYRNVHDEKTDPCTQPPSHIRDLIVVDITHTTSNVTWLEPPYLGGRIDIKYSIICMNCEHTVKITPSGGTFSQTWSYLENLVPGKLYYVTINASNGVSNMSGAKPSNFTSFKTEAAIPKKIDSLRISGGGSTFIEIAWDSPNSIPIEMYDIRYKANSEESKFFYTQTKAYNYTFRNLQKATRYSFEVRGRTEKGWGEYSHSVSAVTGQILKSESTIGSSIIAASVVAVFVCIFLIALLLFILIRRNRHCIGKSISDCDNLHYSNVESPSIISSSHINNAGMSMPLFKPAGSVKSYIDPYTYEDPNQAVREFAKEIDISRITIESVIGSGEFGDVCKGRLRLSDRSDMHVAIKTLKVNASERSMLDFLTEASIMGQFVDPNVIFLEGVVTKSNPIMIVTEFMENGSLDSFLKLNDGKLSTSQLVDMMRGVASGMLYLSEMGYVHRDLAARNILVNHSLVCKVADFGLSRELDLDTSGGAYTTRGGKIPVRWTAPEAISYRKFTSASDVWSYGVVMWEIVSYGERPYWTWSNHDVITNVEKGFRLPPPMDCPDTIYKLMLECWKKDRSERPKFDKIVEVLEYLLINIDILLKPAQQPYVAYDNGTLHYSISDNETLESWLNKLKMDRYYINFYEAGFTRLEQIVNLTLHDIIALNITLVGHQKKIINNIQLLKAQLPDVVLTGEILI